MLRKELSTGLVIFLGNQESAFNYPSNTYSFRQDSSFLYFFGLDHPDLAGMMDLDNGTDHIFGNDVDIDDIIWMGKQPTMNEQGQLVAVENIASLKDLAGVIKDALASGRKVHSFLLTGVKPSNGFPTCWESIILT